MSQPPTIVSIREAPERFASIRDSAAFAEIEAHPQTGAYARLYYPAVHGEACRDVSFAVLIDDKPQAVVLCTVLSGKLCLYGLPLRLFHAAESGGDIRQRAVKAAFGEIDRLATESGACEVVARDEAGPVLTEIGEACLSRDARAEVKVISAVDLKLGEAGWRRSLRKSFRSLVNWGQRNLKLSHFSGTCDDLSEAFETFQSFHLEVAGRVTRPDASWRAMQHWVSTGRGELILARFEDRLVSANLFIDGTQTSIYMTGVYDRSRFDKPLAHYPLWAGMINTHARGLLLADLGDFHLPGMATDKERSIGYFKRGFATHLANHLIWRWSPGAGGVRQ